MEGSTAIQKGYAHVNNTTIYYEVAGTGHPLILLHGHLLDRTSWDDQFETFAQHYKVIRYDQRGFGDSGLIEKGKTYSDRQDLYALMEFLQVERAALIGVSGGGGLALDFTLEHPEKVNALILVTSSVNGYQPSETVMKNNPEVVRMYTELSKAFDEHNIPQAVEVSLALWTDGPGRLPQRANTEARERVRKMTLRNWQRPDDEAQAETPPIPLEPSAIGRLSEIRIPTLVLLGEFDGPNPLEQLVSDIAGAKKVVMSDTAHHPFMEKPDDFNHIVLGFLADVKL